MGIDEGLLKLAYRNSFIIPDENNKIFIVNVAKKFISVSTDRKEKKITKKCLVKEGVPELPQEVNELLTSELKALQKVIEDPKYKNKLNMDKVDKTIREIFVKVMVMLLGDYKNYVKSVDDGYVCFNYDEFLYSRPKNYKKFYQELIQTQIFKEFLQKEKNNYSSMSVSGNNCGNNNTFFNNMCVRYISLINPAIKKTSSLSILTGKSEKRSSSVSQKDLVIESEIDTLSGKRIGSVNNSPVKGKRKNSITKINQNNNSFVSNSNTNSSTNQKNSKSPNLIPHQKIKTSHDDIINLNNLNNLSDSSRGFSLANENTASNTKEAADCFLISPYFINDPISKFDQNKIEEILPQKFPSELLDEEKISKRILINNISFNQTEEKNKNTIRRYYIVDCNYHNYNSNLNNLNNMCNVSNVYTNNPFKYSFKSIFSNNSESDEESILLKQNLDKVSETIRSTIDDSLAIIFSGKEEALTPNQNNLIKKILAFRQGRFYLANTLYILMYKESKNQNIFCLPNKNFNDLSKLMYIFLAYSEDNENEYKEIRLITKATFYYYR